MSDRQPIHAEAAETDLEWHVWPPPERRPGGQRVHRTCVGVLVIHKPTGLAAVSVDGRSQHANKLTALSLLQRYLSAESELARMRPVYEAACAARDRAAELDATLRTRPTRDDPDRLAKRPMWALRAEESEEAWRRATEATDAEVDRARASR